MQNIKDMKKIIEMANLEVDCKIAKDRHFLAADRKNWRRIYLGLFAVVGSAVIASGIGEGISTYFREWVTDKEMWGKSSKVIGDLLPLLVSISTATLGFLGLEKQTTQHRFVGNSYTEISRRVRSIINSINDENYDQQIIAYNALVERYIETNREGESCPTNENDSKNAMAMNSKKRESIKRKIAQFDKEYFGLSEFVSTKPFSAWTAVIRATKSRWFYLLVSLRLVRKSDYRTLLRKIT